MPDFGASVSVAYFLLFCIQSKLGGREWLEFCQRNFTPVLNFCLYAYDKIEHYLLPHSENHSKALLLPRLNTVPDVDEYTMSLKAAIKKQMDNPKEKMGKLLKAVKPHIGLEHVMDLILKWQISEHLRVDKDSSFKAWSELGEFAGGFATGVLKATS